MNHVKYHLLVIVLSILPLLSIFITSDLPHTHDGPVHLARMAAYFKALVDGHFPVRWAGDLNYGYGMPLFNFIYQLPYLISSLFLFLGFNLVNSFKLTLAASFILSGIFIFTFAKEFFNDTKKALLVTIFYQFAPFRLVELLVRGSFGEVYTYTFLPLVLFGLVRLFKKVNLVNFLITAIATALLILSHNSLSLIFFITSLGFYLIFVPSLAGIAAMIVGLALPAFYWIPAIVEHKYTYGDLFMRNLYLSHFAPIKNFFIPNLTNNPNLQTGGISVQIGLFHTIALLLSVGLLILKRKLGGKSKKIITFCLLLFAISLFFMQPTSKIIWEKVSLLRQFQFPWRFLAVMSFATSLLAVSFLFYQIFKKKTAFAILLFLVVTTTIFYWRPTLGFDKIDEGYYWSYPLNTTYFGETDVIWSAGPATSYPENRVEIISGEGDIQDFNKTNTSQTFIVDAKTDINVVSRTQYFPGWKAYVNGEPRPIQFQDPNWRGLITFSVPTGNHQIKIIFEETKLRFLANTISLSTFIALLTTLLFELKKRVL